MRVREHFLLGTERATISVTARGNEDRETLFIHAMDAIFAKYAEEFGPQNAAKLVEGMRVAVDSDTSGVTWRLSDDDSCWTEVKRQLAGKDDTKRHAQRGQSGLALSRSTAQPHTKIRTCSRIVIH